MLKTAERPSLNLGFALICILGVLVLLPTPAAAKPDLEIVFLKIPNPADGTTTGMPLDILIRNNGAASSDIFKISASIVGQMVFTSYSLDRANRMTLGMFGMGPFLVQNISKDFQLI